ncbi:MAG: hypothetical protein HY985_12545 [Magnetospirillum sp.]|nr:hypothetical protein [Magnetospirillum sp.]
MKYQRLIACIPLKRGVAVQSHLFSRYLPIGRPEIVADFLCRWGADEIALLDLDASLNGCGPDTDMIRRVSAAISVPLLYGGGLASARNACDAVRAGADKVAFNTVLYSNPSVLGDAARLLGAQCVVASIDVTLRNGEYRPYNRSIPASAENDLAGVLSRLQEGCCGELMINSVERDGQRCGYDIDLVRAVRKHSAIPVIAVGGAGLPDHFAELFQIAEVAAGVGNMLNHTEHSIARIKYALKEKGWAMRTGDGPAYDGVRFGPMGRPYADVGKGEHGNREPSQR